MPPVDPWDDDIETNDVYMTSFIELIQERYVCCSAALNREAIILLEEFSELLDLLYAEDSHAKFNRFFPVRDKLRKLSQLGESDISDDSCAQESNSEPTPMWRPLRPI